MDLCSGLRLLALAAMLAAPLAGSAGQAPQGDQPGPSGERRESRNRLTFLDDPRLAADSTLFPHEWPALERLRLELATLREALESAAVPELAAALPAVQALVDTLSADTLPTLLAARSDEVRGRIAALEDALGTLRSLAPAALAAAPDTGAGPYADDVGDVGEDGDQGGALPAPSPLDSLSALDSTPAADSVGPVDPIEAYLEAWRSLYAHHEALLHRVRDPFSG